MVTHGHFTLTENQRRFKEKLTMYPRLMPYWDFDKRECDTDGLSKTMGTFSHQERIMASFFAAVWLGENKYILRYN